MMRIETERLILRLFESGDEAALYAYLSDKEVVKWEPYAPITRDQIGEVLRERMASDEMIAIELKENHTVIGNVYLGKSAFRARELGYLLNRAYWGRGYATEACTAAVEKAFADGAHRVYAECDPGNEKSWRLLERLGFIREAHLRENVYFWLDENGCPIWKDTYIYGKLKP